MAEGPSKEIASVVEKLRDDVVVSQTTIATVAGTLSTTGVLGVATIRNDVTVRRSHHAQAQCLVS